MATCVNSVDVGGVQVLQATTETIEQCTGYILNSVAEQQALPTLIDVFNMPLADEMQTMWLAGFGLPMICFLVSSAFGEVINFIYSNYRNH